MSIRHRAWHKQDMVLSPCSGPSLALLNSQSRCRIILFDWSYPAGITCSSDFRDTPTGLWRCNPRSLGVALSH